MHIDGYVSFHWQKNIVLLKANTPLYPLIYVHLEALLPIVQDLSSKMRVTGSAG